MAKSVNVPVVVLDILILTTEEYKKCFLQHLLLQPCDGTQLDFMAEQCSQTDLHPLHLQPNTASFYTWIPAVGFTQGGQKEMLPYT